MVPTMVVSSAIVPANVAAPGATSKDILETRAVYRSMHGRAVNRSAACGFDRAHRDPADLILRLREGIREIERNPYALDVGDARRH